jgi:hypothetical protein
VTFISIHYVVIYVVFFGACMRCTRLCSLKPGVTKPPRIYPNLTRDPWVLGTIPAAKITVVRLTGGEIAPTKWSMTWGRSRWSRRCASRRRGWSDLARAQAGKLVGGEDSGLTMVA